MKQMNNTCANCGGFVGNFIWSGDGAKVCNCRHQNPQEDKVIKTCTNIDCPERKGGRCTAVEVQPQKWEPTVDYCVKWLEKLGTLTTIGTQLVHIRNLLNLMTEQTKNELREKIEKMTIASDDQHTLICLREFKRQILEIL